MKIISSLVLLAITPLFLCCTKEEKDSDEPLITLNESKLIFTDEVKVNSFTLKSNTEFWHFEEKYLSPVYGLTSAESTWFKIDPYCGKEGEYMVEVTAFDGAKDNVSTLNVVVDDEVVASLDLIQR